jgi:hypothetical protein
MVLTSHEQLVTLCIIKMFYALLGSIIIVPYNQSPPFISYIREILEYGIRVPVKYLHSTCTDPPLCLPVLPVSLGSWIPRVPSGPFGVPLDPSAYPLVPLVSLGS